MSDSRSGNCGVSCVFWKFWFSFGEVTYVQLTPNFTDDVRQIDSLSIEVIPSQVDSLLIAMT